MKLSVRSKDLGLKNMSRALRAELRKNSVEVGVFGEAGSDIAVRASVHEYGSKSQGIPERSFIRSTLKDRAAEYREAAGRVWSNLADSLTRSSPDLKPLELFGQKLASDIRQKIRTNIPPPLKQETIDRKGSSMALIDTGQMINAITYRVKHGD